MRKRTGGKVGEADKLLKHIEIKSIKLIIFI